MPLTSTQRSKRCRLMQRSKSTSPTVIASKVKKFLVSYPDQVGVVDAWMRKLAVKVKKEDQWAKDHPTGKASEFNEDAGDS